MSEQLMRLESEVDDSRVTYVPPVFGDGRFEFLDVLNAGGGQGYALLVRDTWTDGLGVLKGLWWEEHRLNDHRRVAEALAENNQSIASGISAMRRATELTQQAPAVITMLRDPSPAMIERDYPEPLEEYFAVQQFVGSAGAAATTLAAQITERVRTASRFTELELLDLAAQLCDTLAAVHVRRRQPGGRQTYWVHADIKPQNILVLGPPWRYILIDYDGALEEGATIPLTTEHYAPPRRADGVRPEMDRAAAKFDIYMLGATLAEAAGLRRLDDDTRADLYGEQTRHTRGKHRIRELGYGPIVTTVIASCLADPDFRLASAADIAADLARARSATTLSELLLAQS